LQQTDANALHFRYRLAIEAERRSEVKEAPRAVLANRPLSTAEKCTSLGYLTRSI